MRKRGDRAWYRPRRVHGRDRWEVCAVINGSGPHTSLVDTEAEAIREVDRLRATLRGDRVPPRDWAGAVEAYIASREMGPESAATVRYRLRAVDAILRRHPLQLTEADANVFRRQRLEQASPTTVHHEMRAVVALQSWMAAQGWIRLSTWADATIPEAQRNESFLHPDELGAFLRAAERLTADPTLGDAASNRLAEDWTRWEAAAWILCHGPRTREAQRLRVRDIDLRAGIVWVYGTKSTAARRAFVVRAERGLDVLERTFRDADPDELAFPTGRLGVPSAAARTKWFARRTEITCEVAGIRIVSPHALRHSAATAAIVEGADLNSVQNLLGHTTPMITARTYSHAQAAVKSLAAATALGTVLQRAYDAKPRLKLI